jgi:hypothetical protein
MLGSGKKGEETATEAPGKKAERKPQPAAEPAAPRTVAEIDAEILRLQKVDRAEEERIERIEQLRQERARSIADSEESQRQAKIAELRPVLERHLANWKRQMADTDDGMRVLMRQFLHALKDASAVRKAQLGIERLGGNPGPVHGLRSHFLDYYTYERLMALWKEICPNATGPRQAVRN